MMFSVSRRRIGGGWTRSAVQIAVKYRSKLATAAEVRTSSTPDKTAPEKLRAMEWRVFGWVLFPKLPESAGVRLGGVTLNDISRQLALESFRHAISRATAPNLRFQISDIIIHVSIDCIIPPECRHLERLPFARRQSALIVRAAAASPADQHATTTAIFYPGCLQQSDGPQQSLRDPAHSTLVSRLDECETGQKSAGARRTIIQSHLIPVALKTGAAAR